MTDPHPDIEVSTGPYGVHGLPLVRGHLDTGTDGTDQQWVVTGEVDTDGQADESGTYWLCRCGQSKSKPFCDGTHRAVGFDGTETATAEPYRAQATTMTGDGVVVRDARALCEHAGFCSARGTNVWKMVGSSDPEELDRMRQMIDHCPSGALTHAASESAPDDEPALPQRVMVVDDGPYLVTGGVGLRRSDGVDLEERNRVTLCRCGASKNKPLCDGSHASTGFSDHGE